jgi:hypothetical protein
MFVTYKETKNILYMEFNMFSKYMNLFYTENQIILLSVQIKKIEICTNLKLVVFQIIQLYFLIKCTGSTTKGVITILIHMDNLENVTTVLSCMVPHHKSSS